MLHPYITLINIGIIGNEKCNIRVYPYVRFYYYIVVGVNKMIDIIGVTAKIEKLLEDQIWYKKLILEVPNELDKIKLKKTLINRAVGIHTSISDNEEKQIFEKLLSEIDILTLSDYQHLVNKCYLQLRDKYPSIEKFYIVPLLKVTDSESLKVKSGLFVSYLFNTYQFSLINEMEGLKDVQIIIKRYLRNDDVEKILNDEKSFIVFIDDFVGTGRTVTNVYNSYEKIPEMKQFDWRRRTCVLSLSILDKGLNLLESEKISVIFGLKHTNIPLKFSNNELELKNIMRMIERISKKSNVRKDLTYGYGGCLSTIITIRTPNNNIPFLWTKGLKTSKALFVRNG